jgi:phosphoglycerate dehydrogenase-like enzyme
LVDIVGPPQTRESVKANPSILAEVDVIFSGWGAPLMDEEFLQAAPNLRAVFYGAGSIRNFATDALWRRKIVVTSAYAANAVPVAEYTLATILLSLKHFWRFSALAKAGCGWGLHTRPVLGGYQATIGMISCGMVVRKTLQLLEAFDHRRLVSCPFLSQTEADALGVERCELDDIFKRSDVVSLHTPELPETQGMITGRHLALMKPNSTFINTARGAVVREREMIEVLRERPDLTVVLDVTDPEPPEPAYPLLKLPNVVVTPHIAGSMGSEIRRLGGYMVAELRRFVSGEPLQWQITEQQSRKLA